MSCSCRQPLNAAAPMVFNVDGRTTFRNPALPLSAPSAIVCTPSGMTISEEVGDYAFNRCHAIEELVFPKSMTKIGAFAFLYCDNLKKVVLEGPEHLSKAVFSHNLMLEEVALNRNVDDSNFMQEVFQGCIRLRKITLSGEQFEVANLVEAMDSHSDFPQVIRSIAQSASPISDNDLFAEGVLSMKHLKFIPLSH